jgi:hypothetical protein
LRVRWSINGTSAGEGRTLRLNTSTLPAGTHVVQVEVTDQTPLVRSDPTGLLAARHSWTVATTPGNGVTGRTVTARLASGRRAAEAKYPRAAATSGSAARR